MSAQTTCLRGTLRRRWAGSPAIALLLFLALTSARAGAGVMLQAFYWDVPSPGAGQPSADWWWDHLAKQAESLRAAGITAVWLPPVAKGASGSHSVGYDPFDEYDIGSKNQKGTIPTRYGSREQLARCVAILRANGIDVYVDLVLNHRRGDDGQFNFRYADAYGNPTGGRFEKGPKDFHPNVPEDPNVAEPELNFGRDLAHVNSPGGHVAKGLTANGDWLTRALDLQGYRIDAAKAFSSDFLLPFLNAGAMRGKFAVSEFYEGGADKLENWLQQRMRGRCSNFDFPLQLALRDMCNRGAAFDMRKLERAGLVAVDPDRAVTFVENHDTDRSADHIIKGKELAYALILTSEGYPCVYYRDYSTDEGCYKMRPTLDKLLWIHERVAAGKTIVRHKDANTFIYERTGGEGLLVALNNRGDQGKEITVETRFRPGVLLHDYAGNGTDVRVGRNGAVTYTVPKNDASRGFVCYSRSGIRSELPRTERSVTQEFEAAEDLDIRPAEAATTTIGRIWPAAGQKIAARLKADTKNWAAETALVVELLDPAGQTLATKSFAAKDNPQARLEAAAAAIGWHEFRIHAVNPPPGAPRVRFTLAVTYSAPNKLVETPQNR